MQTIIFNIFFLYRVRDFRNQMENGLCGTYSYIKNYRPVSLLPIFRKIFGRLIYNEMYSFFIESDLVSSNQSGFKQEDSCINQILSITHDVYQSLNQGYKVRGVFLDFSKAFDKVWNEGLIH